MPYYVPLRYSVDRVRWLSRRHVRYALLFGYREGDYR